MFVAALASIVFAANLAFAQQYRPLRLELNDYEFEPGETVEISAYVYNSQAVQSMAKLRCFIGQKNADALTIGLEKDFVLDSGEYKKIDLYNLTVAQDSESGTYIVQVDFLLDGNLIDSASSNFTISKTSEKIYFNLSTCKDDACYTPSRVFLKNETVFIRILGENADFSGSLTAPTGGMAVLQFDAGIAKVQPVEIGTYTADITATKTDFTTTEKTIQFAVIEKEAQISTGEFTSPPWWIGFGELNIVYVIAAALVLAVIVAAMLSMRAKMRGVPAEPRPANRF